MKCELATKSWFSREEEDTIQYQYKMESMSTRFLKKKGMDFGQTAAFHLDEVVSAHAKQGWEFYRVVSLAVEQPPGCLGQLFGQTTQSVPLHVVVFRREVSAR